MGECGEYVVEEHFDTVKELFKIKKISVSFENQSLIVTQYG